MKVLVIDDSVINQESARQSLAGHDLTVVGNTVDAQALLRGENFDFDAVLTDLLMPLPVAQAYRAAEGYCSPFGSGATCVSIEACKGEHPVGLMFALTAAARGAKFVAVVSNASHHAHPVAAQLDYFSWIDEEPLVIRNAKVRFLNEPKHLQSGGKDWAWVLQKLEEKATVPSQG